MLLPPAEGGGFTGGSAEHQTIGAMVHQVHRQAGRQLQIHRTAGGEGGDHGREHPAEGGR